MGIGGAGMSGIANVLFDRGQDVSGSDRERSDYIRALEARGIPVSIGHDAHHVEDAELVVASSAIPADNVELLRARELGIPVLHRDEYLGRLTAGKRVIAVAGTHGKTTTSALIAWILEQTGQKPSFLVGGMLPDLGTNARAGEGPAFVIEADEYDRAFLGLQPAVAVITSVEHDHPDCYPTARDYEGAFEAFAAKVSERIFVCADEPHAAALAAQHSSYGTAEEADWHAADVQSNAAGGNDFLVLHGGETLGLARIRLPGEHNVRNALAAIAVASEEGVAFKALAAALLDFHGAGRRFDVRGNAAGVTVIDDYAHHPTEIRATLQAVRERFPEGDVWAVFQPHTYSRLRALLDDFTGAFEGADHVLVTEVFAARERPDGVVSGELLAGRIRKPPAAFVPDFEAAVSALAEGVSQGSVVVTLSAGDGNRIGELLLERLKRHEGEEHHG